MNKTAGSATHRWFGLSPSQFFWFVTGSVLWLTVALLLTGVVINAAANTQHRR
jgi:hypothetical protein